MSRSKRACRDTKETQSCDTAASTGGSFFGSSQANRGRLSGYGASASVYWKS